MSYYKNKQFNEICSSNSGCCTLERFNGGGGRGGGGAARPGGGGGGGMRPGGGGGMRPGGGGGMRPGGGGGMRPGGGGGMRPGGGGGMRPGPGYRPWYGGNWNTVNYVGYSDVYYPYNYYNYPEFDNSYYTANRISLWNAIVIMINNYGDILTDVQQQEILNYVTSLNLPIDYEKMRLVLSNKQALYDFLNGYYYVLGNTYTVI